MLSKNNQINSNSNKIISKKLFWILFILSNAVWVIAFVYLLYFLKSEAGIWGLGIIIPGLFGSTIFGLVVNIILPSAKKHNDRQLFIVSSSIFVAIGVIIYTPICWEEYNINKQINERDARSKIVGEITNKSLQEAKNYEDCKQLSVQLTNSQEKHSMLTKCFEKFLYSTRDIEGCLSVAKSLEMPLDLNVSYDCIYRYKIIMKNDDYCDLFKNVRGGDRYIDGCKSISTTD
ncbi:MAG: hypothetical protein WCV69_01885 [Patescibacteria group bacterium]|jgi:hypothetical protein